MKTSAQFTAFTFLAAALVCSAFADSDAPVVATDPTRPSGKFAESLKGRMTDLGGLETAALVVGADNDGVAILRDAAGKRHVVRSGSTVPQKIGDLPVNLVAASVTSAGVEFESETTSLVLPSHFKPVPAETPVAPASLRYIECDEVELETVLRLISDQTGVNIAASAATAKTPVSLFLRNVKAETAVEEICRSAGLWFRRDGADGIIRVTTMDEYRSSLASFREEETESFTLLYPNVIEVASVIYGLYPERVLLSLGEDEILDDEENDISRRFGRFNSIADSGGSSFLNMDVKNASSGSASSSSGTLSFNNGRVTMIEPYRGATINVNDAKHLTAAEMSGDTNAFVTAVSAIGGQSANIFVTVSRKNSMLMVRTSDSKAMNDIRALIKRLDVPTPMVLLEVKVLELQIDDDFTSSFQYQFQKDYNTTSEHSEKNVTAATRDSTRSRPNPAPTLSRSSSSASISRHGSSLWKRTAKPKLSPRPCYSRRITKFRGSSSAKSVQW